MKLKSINKPFILILLTAIAIRLFVIYTKYHSINADNCILGLMAKHILKGEFPVFFWGQSYMGSLEAFIIALFFFFFGVSTNTMVLAMAFISLCFVISAYYLGKEIQDKKFGILTMLFACIPPQYVFWNNLSALGGYPETLVFGNIALLLTLKIVKSETTSKKIKYYTLLGFVSGLAIWTHLLIIYYLVPIAIFLLVNEKKSFLLLKAPLASIPAFILGGLPFWIYNIKHHFISLSFPIGTPTREVFVHFFYLIYYLLTGGTPNLYPFIILSIYFIAVAFLVTHNIKTHFLSSINFLFLLLGTSTIYFFSTNHMAAGASPRHIIPLFTTILIALPYLAWRLNKKIRYAGYILLTAVLTYNSVTLIKSYQVDKEESYGDYIFFSKLIDFLDTHNLKTNYCVYWISQKLNFLSNEKIINSEFESERYLPYETALEKSDNVAFIERGKDIEAYLDMLSNRHDKTTMGDFNIYYNFQPKGQCGQLIPSSLWSAESNYNTKDAKFAFDRNIDKYWCSIGKKHKGTYLKLDMGKVYEIYKLAIYNSEHWRNYSFNITVEVSSDEKKWTRINVPNMLEPLFVSGPRLYTHIKDGRFELVFKPTKCRYLKIINNGPTSMYEKHPWEINEIFVWTYQGTRKIEFSEAEEIYNFISQQKITSIYADFWLSAKIDSLSNGKIKTIKPINERYPENGLSRFFQIMNGDGFIIDNENIEEFKQTILPLGINLMENQFKNYTLYWNENNIRLSEIFFWSGYGILKTNRFMPPLEENIIETPTEIIFENGAKLLGYNAKKEGGNLHIDYFWQIKKLPNNLFMFVYFLNGENIIFQNDHPLLEQFPLTKVPKSDNIFRESYILKNVPSGTYDISIGLWNPKKSNKRIKIIHPSHRGSKAHIGTISI